MCFPQGIPECESLPWRECLRGILKRQPRIKMSREGKWNVYPPFMGWAGSWAFESQDAAFRFAARKWPAKK